MKGKIFTAIKYVLFLGIGVFLLYKVLADLSFSKLKTANYYWVALSLLFSLAALFSRAYRWGMLIEPISGMPKLKYLFYALNSGYAANLLFPRLGEVTRCTVLYKTEKTTVEALIATVIAERVVDVLSLLTLIIITILLNFKKFGDFFYEQLLKDKLSSLSTLSTGKITLLILIPLVGIFILYLLRKRLSQAPFSQKIIKFLKGVLEGLKSVLKLKNKWLFLFHTIFIWGMYYISCYVCFFAIPETSGLSLEAGMLILVLGGIGMSAPVNGGVGVYHYLVIAGLALYGILPYEDPVTHLEESAGKTFAIIVHTSQMLFLVFLGLLSLLLLGFDTRKMKKMNSPTNK